MKIIENWLSTSDGKTIFYHEFLPKDRKVKFVVQIFHGMAEHSERYTDFANYLVDKGGAVYVSDHRGHGRNAVSDDDYGFWPEKNEWSNVVDDLKILNDITAKNFPNIPNFILGHSMGSFLARTFITSYNAGLKGVILSGTGANPTMVLEAGKLIARIQCFFSGVSKRSNLLDKMSFGSFNKGYHSPFQWLSRDQEIVDKYIADPRCGEVFTCSFYRGFMSGLIQINKLKNANRIRKELPLLFVSGKNDPVGNFGKGVKKSYEFYEKAGLKNLDFRLFDGARHEILNETNKQEVYDFVFNWIETKI